MGPRLLALALAAALGLAGCAPRRAPSPPPAPEAKATTPSRRPAPLAAWERRPVRTLVIDAGHGGRDPGATGVDGLLEKDVTLELAERMRARLVRWGFRVVMTRSGDETVPLADRLRRAEEGGGDVFLSLHVNASPKPALEGLETYYLDEADGRHDDEVAARENGIAPTEAGELDLALAQLRVSEVSARSADLAHHVHGAVMRGLRSRYGTVPDRGVRRGPFYVLFLSTMPAILVEVGFATSPSDAARLRDDAHLELLADRLASGLMAYAIANGAVVADDEP